MTNCTPITETVIDGEGNTSDFPIPPASLTPIPINSDVTLPVVLQAATAGMLTRVYRLFLVASGDTTLTFYDGSTPLAPVLTLVAGEQMVLDAGLFPWFQGTADTNFSMESVAAVTLTGAAWINLNPT